MKISKDTFKNLFEILRISENLNMTIPEYYINPLTSEIVSKKSLKIIGSKSKAGYVLCSLSKFKKVYYQHTLAYIHSIDELEYDTSKFEIDHINRIRDDNRITNLRLISISDNRKNRIFSKKSDEQIALKLLNKNKQIQATNINNEEILLFKNIKLSSDALNISSAIIS